ncbi:uncharacterized protein LOC131651423 [Vicia villosa]|uniref:uncharacterized protein LOC131651423 n=1 Tax=Vicia villosa TaxID=3911 RepID=UPI00273C4DB6|nr:uncharacterized protein LOC131651423 [Vicia villosa]
MSGLRINFNKSRIYGVHVTQWLMEAASNLLSRDIDYLPFKNLGVSVGKSPRKLSLWKGLISNLKNKLSALKGRYLNMAGRVVLINVVLNAIPIYTLSFYKASSKVIQEIRHIQSNYLWQGRDGNYSTHWIRWSTVCLSKEKGGLGIKDVKTLNIALLNKWKWRIINEKEVVWRDIISHRYANLVLKIFVGDKSVLSKKDSIWWRDLILSDDSVNSNFCFAGGVVSKVANRRGTSFWFSNWMCQQSLKDAFPEVIPLALINYCSVEDAGNWQDDEWHWNLDGIVESHNPVVQNFRGEIPALLNDVILIREDEYSYV